MTNGYIFSIPIYILYRLNFHFLSSTIAYFNSKSSSAKYFYFLNVWISGGNDQVCIRRNHCLGQSKANQSQIASRMSSCQLGLAYRFLISCHKASFLSTMVLSNVSKLTFQQNSCLCRKPQLHNELGILCDIFAITSL